VPSPAQRDDLAGDLCQLGRQAGLDAVGVCDASPFHEALAALNAGRQHGWDAGMQFTYRNPERSTDPQRALPGAKSMVVGARRYDRNATADADDARPRGFVGRYAWEDHYRHLRDGLGQVADHLRSRGWRATVLVDDNALVDRAAAVRAGLGWYGKNTNVLIPGAGSWFVLGSVVTDAPLPGGSYESGSGFERNSARIHAQNPNPRPNAVQPEVGSPPAATLTPGPIEDGCGTCRRCIDACPTGALTHDEAGHLDAGKCLAWLVQAPGIFPSEYRVALHDRMYGCDDCQEACPVNRLASRKDPPPAADPHAQVTVDVLDILNTSTAELLERFGRWYIAKRDPAYLRRNALIVLGNIGDPDDPEIRTAIDRATTHREPIIRAHAVWAAARLGYHDLIPTSDSDPRVQHEIDAAPYVTSRAVPA
jgi:epoxyqueuosine reductase